MKTKALSTIEPSREVLIDRFLSEKKYLENLSERTLEIYGFSFKAFSGSMDSIEAVKARITELRKRGLSPVSVNTYLRHVKCFFLWQGKEWKLPWLKEEKKILATFSAEHISKFIHWKPRSRSEGRLKALNLTALDTGLRIDELLSLERRNVSFENLTILVRGKGGKERLVPMSLELRKTLYKHLASHNHILVFCTARGLKNTTPIYMLSI